MHATTDHGDPPMVVEALTAAERRQHEKAVARIRERLFRRHAPDEYRILEHSETIIAAHAESRWNAGCGSYRVLHLGGLTYRFDCGAGHPPGAMSICHSERDLFSFWVCGAQDHTVHSSRLRFAELDSRVFQIVNGFRASLRPIRRGA
jgi:hypothetical protein